MGLADRVRAQLRGNPVPAAPQWEWGRGHDDSTYSPVEYGDYIVTSNDVYTVIQRRVDALLDAKLRFFRGTSVDRKEVAAGPIVDLFASVNPFWTWEDLLDMTEKSMGLWGEAYWVMVSPNDPTAPPSELWWVKPSQMKPVPHPTRYLAGFEYCPPDGGRAIPFRTDEVVWFRYPNPNDEYSPLSPLAAARLAADTASDAMRANRSLYREGWNIGGLVMPAGEKVTYSLDEAKQFEEGLSRRFRGADKAHRWAVLRFRADVRQMGVTPRDAEFVNGLNLTFRQVARAYGVPPPLAGDLENATLANVEVYQRALWDMALKAQCRRYASTITEKVVSRFPRVTTAEFDFSGVPALQEASTAVWDRERGQIEVGALTVNEWRKSKGLPAVPWGDVWWAPVNKGAVSSPEDMPATDPGPLLVGDAPPPRTNGHRPDDFDLLLSAFDR